MDIGIKFRTQWVDLGDAVFLEHAGQLFQGEIDAALQTIEADRIARRQGSLQTVLNRQQFTGELIHGEFTGLFGILGAAPTHIFGFSLGPEPGIVMLLGQQFGLAKFFFQAGRGLLSCGFAIGGICFSHLGGSQIFIRHIGSLLQPTSNGDGHKDFKSARLGFPRIPGSSPNAR